MAVGAISASEVRPNVYNTSFGGKKKGGSANLSVQKDTADLAKVPVMVMIAMSPAMLNANEPVKALPIDAEQLTEIIAAPRQEKVVSTINFHQAQQKQKKNFFLPGGFAYLDIQERFKADMDGIETRVILAKCDESKNASPNQVDKIYFIPSDYKDENENHYLPEIIEFVYHNLPDGKDYLSVKTVEYVYKSDKDIKPIKALFKDVRINDRSAQYLLDLQTGDTRWKDATGIPFRVTSSPDTEPPNIIDLAR